METLQLEEYQKFTSFTEINEVMEILMERVNKGAGVYSGSRRIGYYVQGEADGIYPNKQSLISLLNERPPFIYITRLLKKYSNANKTTTEILMCNHMHE